MIQQDVLHQPAGVLRKRKGNAVAESRIDSVYLETFPKALLQGPGKFRHPMDKIGFQQRRRVILNFILGNAEGLFEVGNTRQASDVCHQVHSKK